MSHLFKPSIDTTQDETTILFDADHIVQLNAGTVYTQRGQKVLELQTGSYDISYLMTLIHQCKTISRTIPMNDHVIGLVRQDNGYFLLTE